MFFSLRFTLIFFSIFMLYSCGDSGGIVSKGHRDAIKIQCENSSDPKACGLEVRENFIEEGNEYVILDDGDLDKDQIKKIKMECIRSKKFGLETYNNCLQEYKTAALDGKLFEKKFAVKPKSNVEALENHTVRLVILEKRSEDEFEPLGSGSGVILDNNLIATNCHVTDAATDNKNSVIIVKNVNKENYDLAELFKEAPEHDVCIVKKANMSEFSLEMDAVKKFVKFENLKRGDFVRSLGTPEGMEGHSAQGEIQYLGTAAETADGLGYAKDTKVINHSADIAPGSSGGPLFDKNGYLIGLNTFGSDKFNFAISADHIRDLLKK
jgi:S1-C subfamily serine protease